MLHEKAVCVFILCILSQPAYTSIHKKHYSSCIFKYLKKLILTTELIITWMCFNGKLSLENSSKYGTDATQRLNTEDRWRKSGISVCW